MDSALFEPIDTINQKSRCLETEKQSKKNKTLGLNFLFQIEHEEAKEWLFFQVWWGWFKLYSLNWGWPDGGPIAEYHVGHKKWDN